MRVQHKGVPRLTVSSRVISLLEGSRQPSGTDAQKSKIATASYATLGYRCDTERHLDGSKLFYRGCLGESVYHPPEGGCFTALSRSLNSIRGYLKIPDWVQFSRIGASSYGH